MKKGCDVVPLLHIRSEAAHLLNLLEKRRTKSDKKIFFFKSRQYYYATNLSSYKEI